MVKKSRRSRPKQASSVEALKVLHDDMKNVLEYQKTQELRFVPEQKDVPRIRFKKGTIFNVELSYTTTAALSTTAPISSALSFSLASAPNYTSYTTCFDRYRIIQANVKILPSGIATGSGINILSVFDYDDATALGSQSAFFGYSTLKVTPAGQIDERTLTPRIAVAAYAGASFNGYANMPANTWIDSASAGVQYYGLKYYAPTGSAGQSVQFIITMNIQFKQQRA